MEEIFDIGIIGLGPAGLKAANCAIKAGLKAVCYEKEKAGGTCLNVGCIPTKAILHTANSLNEIKNLAKTGIISGLPAEFNFKEIYARKNKIVEKLSTAVEKDLIQKGAKIVAAEAIVEQLKDGFKISSKNGENSNVVRNLIITTGSKPFELPSLKFDGDKILSSNDILNLEECPKSLVIIGSGAIGIEWARIFSNLGTKVTVIEKAENLLPTADLEVSKRILRMFKMAGIQAHTGTEVISFENGIATLSNGKTAEGEKILVAVGRKRIWPEIKLISGKKGEEIAINPDGSTDVPNLYFAGDIVAKKMLAHTASAQAERILDLITTGKTNPVNDEDIPSIVYGTPEIASIGLREQDLPEKFLENPDYKIYNLRIAELPKAWCDGEIEGFIKIITKSGKILGAHIISAEASALITQIQIAIKADMDVNSLREVVFAHPTYSEGIYEALSK